MTPEQQEEVVHHLSIKQEAERRRQEAQDSQTINRSPVMKSMSIKNSLFYLVVMAVVLLCGLFIWPTPYRYDQISIGAYSSPVRINRFTGQAERLIVSGWVTMKTISGGGDVVPENDLASKPIQAPISSRYN
jgi:hypothetical protein